MQINDNEFEAKFNIKDEEFKQNEIFSDTLIARDCSIKLKEIDEQLDMEKMKEGGGGDGMLLDDDELDQDQ
jgi:hypothetical protein